MMGKEKIQIERAPLRCLGKFRRAPKKTKTILPFTRLTVADLILTTYLCHEMLTIRTMSFDDLNQNF
jgi:hypothetical protein